MKYKSAVLILLIAVLAGCDPVVADDSDKSRIKISGYGALRIINDNERDVTCWVYVTSNAGGVSCIPNSQLNQDLSK